MKGTAGGVAFRGCKQGQSERGGRTQTTRNPSRMNAKGCGALATQA